MDDLMKAVWSFIETCAAAVWGFLRKYPFHVVSMVVVVIAANQLLGYVERTAEREITVYVGPPGSSSYRMRERVATAIKGISTTPGFHYRAVVMPTAGYIDIEQRLSDDAAGQSIGMVVDGVSKEENLRTLLPLDWDYLHVIASVRFLQRIRANADDPWARQFSQVVPHLEYDRVFSGAHDSGTRKFAAMLFELHGKKVEDYASPAISNWEDAIPALKADRIDLAFYCGPLQATTVVEVAQSGSAVLLGLDDLQSALLLKPELSLSKQSIPEKLYSVLPLKVPTDTVQRDTGKAVPSSDNKPLYFDERDIPTVAARRLIVTSLAMSDQDAYYISEALTKALVDANDIPENTWERRDPSAPGGRLDSDFGIRTHHGAKMFRDGKGLMRWWQPTTWPSNWQSIVLGVVTLVFTTLLQTSVQWLRQGKSPPQPPAASPDTSPVAPTAPSSPEYQRLIAQCEKLLDELTQAPEPLAAADHQRIVAEVRSLRADIRGGRASGQLRPEEANELDNAHRKLLAELLVLSPQWQKADPV